jgi:hypothetical protein
LKKTLKEFTIMSLRLKVQGPTATVGMSVPESTSTVEFKKLLAECLGIEEGQRFTVLIGFPPAPLAVPDDKDEATVPVSQILRSGDAVRVQLLAAAECLGLGKVTESRGREEIQFQFFKLLLTFLQSLFLCVVIYMLCYVLHSNRYYCLSLKCDVCPPLL